MNSYLNHYRQRVEHVMHSIKEHAMWNGKKLKSSYALMDSCMRLTIHLTNIKIKHGWADDAFHKYPGYYREWPRVSSVIVFVLHRQLAYCSLFAGALVYLSSMVLLCLYSKEPYACNV